MKKLIILSLFLSASVTLSAIIRIVEVTVATSNCYGRITIEATGSAGPFTLSVIKPGGQRLEYGQFSGFKSILNLCAGAYSLEVKNALGCKTSLNANIVTGAPQPDEVQVNIPRRKLQPTFSSQVFPNPFQRHLSLDLESSQADRFELEVYNALGQLILRQTLAAEAGQNRYPLDFGEQSKGILLYLYLKHESGENRQHRVVKVE
jgi:Secretion system C-terminal sorting domain